RSVSAAAPRRPHPRTRTPTSLCAPAARRSVRPCPNSPSRWPTGSRCRPNTAPPRPSSRVGTSPDPSIGAGSGSMSSRSNSGRASRTDSTTAGSSAAPTAVTNRPISPTPRRGRPCDSTREKHVSSETSENPGADETETDKTEAIALGRGVAVAPTTPLRRRCEIFDPLQVLRAGWHGHCVHGGPGRLNLVRRTEGIEEWAQGTGTGGRRVLHRAQGGLCQRLLSLLERAGRNDRFKIRLTEFAMAARPRNGRVAVAGSRDLKKMDAPMVRSGQETKSGVAGQKSTNSLVQPRCTANRT